MPLHHQLVKYGGLQKSRKKTKKSIMDLKLKLTGLFFFFLACISLGKQWSFQTVEMKIVRRTCSDLALSTLHSKALFFSFCKIRSVISFPFYCHVLMQESQNRLFKKLHSGQRKIDCTLYHVNPNLKQSIAISDMIPVPSDDC